MRGNADEIWIIGREKHGIWELRLQTVRLAMFEIRGWVIALARREMIIFQTLTRTQVLS
jgi:hypothetical protein